jgi:hypothetical protein
MSARRGAERSRVNEAQARSLRSDTRLQGHAAHGLSVDVPDPLSTYRHPPVDPLASTLHERPMRPRTGIAAGAHPDTYPQPA